MDFLVPQTPLMWIQSLQSAPDFLCVRVADEGGLAHLTREQMLGFLKQATSGAPHGHSVPVKNSVVHHAEILGNTALVPITRVKDLGTAGNLCSTACFGRSTIPHGVSPENSSIKKPSPIGDDLSSSPSFVLRAIVGSTRHVVWAPILVVDPPATLKSVLVGTPKFRIQSAGDHAYNLGPKTSSMRVRIHYDYPRRTEAMNLDLRVCSRARLARDARFDGKFFIGVLSTRIYCRPVCRARTSQEKNVRYFLTAAAAAEAGFRPCLRCRPECSPGTPAWAGTQNTVSRALRLISETGLEDGGVEALAEHLGVGSRHLRRLFLRHLGATPSAVAQTRRLHFAKKLVDETTLPMTQIAFAAGFGSIRRFNAAIRNVYHRTPTQIRNLAQKMSRQPENHYLFHLNFRPPYDWKRMLEFLVSHATPGVEVAEGGHFRRSISLHGNLGYLEVSLDASRNALNVRVQIGEPRLLFLIIERIRAMFDLDADWPTIARTLGADPALAAHVNSHSGLRVPGCWNGFEIATRAILGQQINTERAGTLAGRMVKAFGQPFCPANGLTHLFPTPEVLARADLETIGLLRTQADAIRALARAVRNGQISFEKVVDSSEFLTRLSEVPGIGESTAQWVAVRTLCEPDAFPSADRDLAGVLRLRSSSEFEQRSLAWTPWRAYAAIYLWTFAREIRARGIASTPCTSKKLSAGKTAFHSQISVAARQAS